MKQIKEITSVTQEEIPPATQKQNVPEAATAAANTTETAANTVTEAATTDTQAAEQPTKDPEVKQQFNGNLLYEESLGSVPGAHGDSHDPRCVFAKFKKDYKEFDFTNEDILEKLEEMDLLKYLRLLQISKPNKSIDIMFKTEDAAEVREVREKPLSFVRKAKRVLKVTVKEVHPEMSSDLLLSELYDYIYDY